MVLEKYRINDTNKQTTNTWYTILYRVFFIGMFLMQITIKRAIISTWLVRPYSPLSLLISGPILTIFIAISSK